MITTDTAELMGLDENAIMESFPVLTRSFSMQQLSQGMVVDPVHRASFESGAYLTRTRTTAAPKRFHIVYPVLSDGDKNLLESWERDVIGYGGAAFTWFHPAEQKLYVAKLLAPIDYAVHPQSAGDLWQVTFDLVVLREAP